MIYFKELRKKLNISKNNNHLLSFAGFNQEQNRPKPSRKKLKARNNTSKL